MCTFSKFLFSTFPSSLALLRSNLGWRFDTQRDGNCSLASDRIDDKESEPLCAETSELTIQKVDTFAKKDQLRPDGKTCFHGEPEILVSTFLKKKIKIGT